MLRQTLLSLLLLLSLTSLSASEPRFRDPSLDLDSRLDDLMSRLTIDEKINILSETSPAIERLDIEGYNHGNEALHGVVRPGNFTVYPRPLGLAATFNPEAIKIMADQISDESRARYNELNHESVGGRYNNRYNGLLTFWSPTVNMARDPRWGRTGETYGEDPYLTATLGAAFTQGLQGDGKYLKAIATPKHFAANNQETKRFSYNATIPMRSLREYYLEGFRGCVVDGGAESIMAAYNAINSIPCSANPLLLQQILRDEWGFKGYVVGDLNSPKYLFTEHHHTHSYPQTAAELLKNGLDLDSGFTPFRYIKEAIELGYCSEEDLDRSVRRVLRGRFLLGMFDPEQMVPYNAIKPEVVGAREHQALSLKLAEQSIVMLKNDGLLPLDKGVKKIALLGPCVDVYKHKQYSVEESSANPAITPSIAFREVCQSRGVELVEIAWEELSGQEQYVPIRSLFLRPSQAIDGYNLGLTGRYYNSETTESDHYLGARVDGDIEINRRRKAPDAYVISKPLTIEWSGDIVAPVTGEYRIRVNYDGDIRVKIGSNEIVGEESGKGESQVVKLSMVKGESTPIEILYSDRAENAAFSLSWIVPESSDRAAVLEQLRGCDVVVMAMGLSNQSTGEGSDKLNLDLPKDQTRLIREVNDINSNIALLLMNSTPLALNWESENIAAILELWYLGEQGGRALTNIIWGEVSPSGKLPITFCRSLDDIPPFTSYDITEGRTYMYAKHEPLYEFGYGLSYTTFDYSDLRLDRESYSEDDTLVARLKVNNSGSFDGDEVVQLYVKAIDVDAEITLPKRQLKGFKRQFIKSGRSATVEIEVAIKDLNYFDESEDCFKVYKGDLEIQIGASSEDIRARRGFRVE